MSKYTNVNSTFNEIWKSDRFLEWEQECPPEHCKYRRKWFENPINQIVGEFPIHLDLECTRRCNLKCPMCIRTIKLERGESFEEGDMDFDLFKKVVDEGSENGLYSVKLSYLGEPLINSNAPKMVKYAKKQGILEVSLNTNGTLLTKGVSRKLINAGLDRLLLSFDSPLKVRYESIRKGAKFDKVIDNVHTLVKLRDEKNLRKPVLRVSMVKMRENMDEIPMFVELWKPIADIISTGDYVNQQWKDKLGREVIELKVHPNFVCPQLYQRLVVSYNGRIGMCCSDFDAEMGLGNAYKQSIKDIWLGKQMQKIRKLHNAGKWEKLSPCAKCTMPYV